jgi:hypothetical protein
MKKNNSFSTERSELNEVNHVWFHQTIKNKLHTDEKENMLSGLPGYTFLCSHFLQKSSE